jgi:cell division protease FtsH
LQGKRATRRFLRRIVAAPPRQGGPRRGGPGRTSLSSPDTDQVSYSRDELDAKIKVSLGGRVAEEVVYGKITTRAEADLQQLSQIARQMVDRWGMSEKLGPITSCPATGTDRSPAPAKPLPNFSG